MSWRLRSHIPSSEDGDDEGRDQDDHDDGKDDHDEGEDGEDEGRDQDAHDDGNGGRGVAVQLCWSANFFREIMTG